MAITGITSKELKNFKNNGGKIIVEVDAEDISEDNSFEQFPDIKKNLFSGFELPPSQVLIDDSEFIVRAFNSDDPWIRIVVYVYRKDGKVVYKKMHNGRFQAEASFLNIHNDIENTTVSK